MEKDTKKIVISSMLAALVCVATMIIKIPSPLKGYLNLGDCVVLLSGWYLSPLYGFFSAGIGSALADIFSGYAYYAPATFIIKGLMALTSNFVFMILNKKTAALSAKFLSGAAAELLMIVGYFIFDGCVYGFEISCINIPANTIQGAAGILIGVILMRILEKSKIL